MLTFGLFRCGAIQFSSILASATHLARCLAEASPSAFIWVSLAHLARILFGWANNLFEHVTVGPRWFWGGASFEDVMKKRLSGEFRAPSPEPNAIAAIAFTREHQNSKAPSTRPESCVPGAFAAGSMQHSSGERDLATFPLLPCDPVWQATGVIPEWISPNRVQSILTRIIGQ
jgi:hypothetical protein